MFSTSSVMSTCAFSYYTGLTHPTKFIKDPASSKSTVRHWSHLCSCTRSTLLSQDGCSIIVYRHSVPTSHLSLCSWAQALSLVEARQPMCQEILFWRWRAITTSQPSIYTLSTLKCSFSTRFSIRSWQFSADLSARLLIVQVWSQRGIWARFTRSVSHWERRVWEVSIEGTQRMCSLLLFTYWWCRLLVRLVLVKVSTRGFGKMTQMICIRKLPKRKNE